MNGFRRGLRIVAEDDNIVREDAGRLGAKTRANPQGAMRSEREAGVLKLLSEATVEAPRLPPLVQKSRMVVIGQDIKDFFDQTPEENCRTFIRKIVDSVQSENYLRLVTDEEKALAEEANRDEWDRPAGKKKRRTWHRGQ